MSVHKSKVLSTPLVFVSDLPEDLTKGENSTILITPRLGLGTDVVDAVRGIRYPDFAKKAIEMRKDREARSEYMRVYMWLSPELPKALPQFLRATKSPSRGSSSYKL